MTFLKLDNIFAQDYDAMWKKVEALEEEDKPRSVLEEVEKILTRAKSEDNFPQMLKAQMRITEKKCDLDPELFMPDEYEKMIEELSNDNKLTSDEKNARLAVMHSELADAYNAMRYSHVHDFDQETREEFPKKVREHLDAALSDMDALARINNEKYKPLTTQQEDGRLYDHDLLCVILDYAMNENSQNYTDEEKVGLYERAITVYEARGNRNAATLLRLRSYEVRHVSSQRSIRFFSNKAYKDALRKLLEDSKELETGIDVAIELCNCYDDEEDEKLTLTRWAYDRWKDIPRATVFRDYEQQILATHIAINSNDNIVANKDFPINISYKNAQNVTLTVREYNGRDKKGELNTTGKVCTSLNFALAQDDYSRMRREKNMPYHGVLESSLSLPAGHYVIVAESETSAQRSQNSQPSQTVKSACELRVTTLRIVSFGTPDKNVCIKVLDNETGRPVEGASVYIYKGWRRTLDTKPDLKLSCDKNGEVSFKNSQNYNTCYAIRDVALLAGAKEDIATTNINNGFEPERPKEHSSINVYTDRSIYRPGQTVYGAAIIYRQHHDTLRIAKNTLCKIEVRDPDYNVLYTTEAETNSLGSLSFEFPLPENGKLGQYNVRAFLKGAQSATTFRMEEYKRPTFEVLFDEKQKELKHQLGEQFEIAGSAQTFSGVPVQDANVSYTLSWAAATPWFWHRPWKVFDGGKTTTDEEGNFKINVSAVLEDIVETDSVEIRIEVDVTDLGGEIQNGEFLFKVKNPDYKDKGQRTKDEEQGPKDKVTLSHEEISEHQGTDVTVVTQEKDALVYYYLFANNKIEMQGSKVVNGDELRFHIDYKKNWGDGVMLHVFYVRNGHFFHESRHITYVRPDKKLNLSWNTFRDNLQPGQNEEWVLTVKDKRGRTVSGAELMAVMYDASLDNINKHEWNFEIFFNRHQVYIPLSMSNGNDNFGLNLSSVFKRYWLKNREFDHLYRFEHGRWYRLSSNRIAGPVMMAKAAMVEGAVVEKSADMSMMNDALPPTTQSTPSVPSTPDQQSLRTNLNELAFFYPHLLTDSKGEAHIAFTLPDGLTEWKFMGIVHTEDLQYGNITAHATAKRDFMIQPNMPRFLRCGDRGEINAKIINLCDNDVNGKATLRILVAETEEVVMTKQVDFKSPAGKTISVNFPVQATLSEGEYYCEVTATDGKASDGERNRLPILSTRVPVVENVPFYIDGAGSKTVDLSVLYNQNSSTASDKKFEIGYTDNPALSVFKSLRAVQNPEHDNAPCFAAALYSNLVLIDMSKKLGNRIEDFDVEKAQQTADKALDKLKELQLGSGAWTWFKGMDGSYYITLVVAEHIERLKSYFTRHGLSLPSDIEKMQKKALKFMDKKELEEFQYRKKHKLSLRPYDDDLRYLAICTNPDKEMLQTYLNEFEKDFKNLTIYGRSKGVVILKKYQREKAAKKFLESVKQYTVYKEGFGRYFATDIAYYSWMDYRIPTQLAAMRGITSYESLAPEENHQYLIDMQLWLLRQKQTQVWDSPLNAIDVADYLLTITPEVSLHEVTVPTLILDGKAVLQDSVYNNIDKVKTLEVTKTSPGISWGHARATFKEEVSNLKTYSSGELTIERKVIRNGNKVTIRHILHADRDMDFVTVMSQHPACLEPLRSLSGYQYMGGRGCYLEVHDSYINLFFDKFTRGTTTIDMDYYIARDGEYNSGFATIECSYAPEFGAHTAADIFK